MPPDGVGDLAEAKVDTVIAINHICAHTHAYTYATGLVKNLFT